MNHPTPSACRHTYARIQAHCAVRTSTRIGKQLRQIVGADGRIDELSPAALQTKFTGADYGEALRLVALAQHIRIKYSRGEHVQA